MENCKKKAFEFWVLKIWIIGDLIKPFESQYIENARIALFSKKRPYFSQIWIPASVLRSIFIAWGGWVRGNIECDFP